MIIALLAITFIFFNPLIFIPYCLLAPKKAADSLYDWDLPVYMDFMQAVYGPFVALLPFRWKRHFMSVRGVEFYSDKLAVPLFQINGTGRQRGTGGLGEKPYVCEGDKSSLV